MTVSFRMGRHSIKPGVGIVEILVDGEVVGAIYPTGEKGIKIVSAHIEKTKTEEGFAGKVVEDDGAKSWPPIPAVLITFELRFYSIIVCRIVKL